MSGKFISFEGGEGSGKSTQLKMIAAAFEKANLPFVSTREPGGTRGAEKIRSLLVAGDEQWNPMSETLLFNAARAEHIEKLIAPALEEGKTVICDRFFDSTLVYQGIGKGLSEEYIKSLHNLVFGNFMPDLTVLLDIDPEIGLRRAGERGSDETRFEQLDIEFHKNIRAGFLRIAEENNSRVAVINAAQTAEDIHSQIIETIENRCGIFLLSPLPQGEG